LSSFPDPKDRIPAILIVDDEALIRLVISDYLQHCGFLVYQAVNAGEAIQILEANQKVIDLVFSNVQMPGPIDGFGLSQWIKKNRPGLQIVLAAGDAKKTAAAKELCQNEPFFANPYDIATIVAHVRSIIDRSKPQPHDH
jgi:CheY-like chemotaxis protein